MDIVCVCVIKAKSNLLTDRYALEKMINYNESPSPMND